LFIIEDAKLHRDRRFTVSRTYPQRAVIAMKSLQGLVGCFVLLTAPVVAQTGAVAENSKYGRDLMAAEKFEEAIPVYRNLVKALPNQPGPLMNLGLALHMAGHDQEAATQFQAVIRLQPRHLPAHLFLGAAYLGLKEPAKALWPLKTFLRAQPNDKDARLLLAEALLGIEQYQLALEQYQHLSKLNPENPKVWNGLGLSYEGLASRSFEEVEKLAPESAYWLVLVADAQAKAEQYNRAFFLCRQALVKMPSLRGVHTVVAEIYRKVGHPDWAVIEEEKERKLAPPNCAALEAVKAAFRTARNNRSSPHDYRRRDAEELECEFWAGRYDSIVSGNAKAAEEYYWHTRAYNELARQAFSHLAQRPPSAEVHELLAKIHFNEKSYAASTKDWQEALKLSPGNPYYLQGLAISFSANTDYESARPLLENLLTKSPGSSELNYWLGYTFLQLEKPKEAIPYLERAVAGDPRLLQIQRDLARAYLRVGQVEKAIPHLRAALPIDEDGSLYYQLAQAYRRSGQRELEKQALRKFKEIESSATVQMKKAKEQFQITAP
jgi:predicted Zn-dependent protease